MFCTDDFRVSEIVQANGYSGLLRIETTLAYRTLLKLLKYDLTEISTRSRLARNGCLLYQTKESITLSGEKASTVLEYRNFFHPFSFEAGQRIGRFFGYSEDEKVDEIEAALEDAEYIFSANGNINMNDILEEPNRYLRKLERTNWNLLREDLTLLETVPIKIPSDSFGLIQELSWQGGTYHVNSRLVDPSFSGKLILEVRTRQDPTSFEKPVIKIDLYKRS